MRDIFGIAFGFAILEAFAGLQSASAAAPKCAPVNCHVYYGTHGPVATCDQRWYANANGSGVRAPQPIQQQKNKRMN
jgi:hypothetical protein